MVELQPSKLVVPVRSRSPAPYLVLHSYLYQPPIRRIRGENYIVAAATTEPTRWIKTVPVNDISFEPDTPTGSDVTIFKLVLAADGMITPLIANDVRDFDTASAEKVSVDGKEVIFESVQAVLQTIVAPK